MAPPTYSVTSVHGINFLRFGYHEDDDFLHAPNQSMWFPPDTSPPSNVKYLIGVNGSGKTSLLESIFILCHLDKLEEPREIKSVARRSNQRCLGDLFLCQYSQNTSDVIQLRRGFKIGAVFDSWFEQNDMSMNPNDICLPCIYVPTHHGSRESLQFYQSLNHTNFIQKLHWKDYLQWDPSAAEAEAEFYADYKNICHEELPKEGDNGMLLLSGGQWDAFLTLYSVHANSDSIILLDEPGQNLGAAERIQLRHALIAAAKKNRNQLIISTHHSEMIDIFSLPDNVVRTHPEKKSSQVHNKRHQALTAHPLVALEEKFLQKVMKDRLQVLNMDSPKMDELKFYWTDPNYTSLLFSERVIAIVKDKGHWDNRWLEEYCYSSEKSDQDIAKLFKWEDSTQHVTLAYFSDHSHLCNIYRICTSVRADLRIVHLKFGESTGDYVFKELRSAAPRTFQVTVNEGDENPFLQKNPSPNDVERASLSLPPLTFESSPLNHYYFTYPLTIICGPNAAGKSGILRSIIREKLNNLWKKKNILIVPQNPDQFSSIEVANRNCFIFSRPFENLSMQDLLTLDFRSLNTSIRRVLPNISISLNTDPTNTDPIIVATEVEDGDSIQIPLPSLSSGEYDALLCVLAFFSKKKYDIIFFDEAGQNLSPPKRFALFEEMRKLAETIKTHIVLITHHTEMLDRFQFPLNTIRIQKDGQPTYPSFPPSKWNFSEQYCRLPFCRGVVLLEGYCDLWTMTLINEALSDPATQDFREKYDIASPILWNFISVGGKPFFSEFRQRCKDLNIPSLTMGDTDYWHPSAAGGHYFLLLLSLQKHFKDPNWNIPEKEINQMSQILFEASPSRRADLYQSCKKFQLQYLQPSSEPDSRVLILPTWITDIEGVWIPKGAPSKDNFDFKCNNCESAIELLAKLQCHSHKKECKHFLNTNIIPEYGKEIMIRIMNDCAQPQHDAVLFLLQKLKAVGAIKGRKMDADVEQNVAKNELYKVTLDNASGHASIMKKLVAILGEENEMKKDEKQQDKPEENGRSGEPEKQLAIIPHFEKALHDNVHTKDLKVGSIEQVKGKKQKKMGYSFACTFEGEITTNLVDLRFDFEIENEGKYQVFTRKTSENKMLICFKKIISEALNEISILNSEDELF